MPRSTRKPMMKTAGREVMEIMKNEGRRMNVISGSTEK
jgi:hypothetical protein